jgi:DNA-directed RNA polymerase specialized sigma24 family protein
MAEYTLFPESVEQLRAAGPNALSEPERQGLVVGVIDWCRKLAHQHARKLRSKGRTPDTDNLEGEAFLAATEAAQYFDERRGVRFTTFAGAWVRTHLMSVTDDRLDVAAAPLDEPAWVEMRADGGDPAVLAEEAEEGQFLRAVEAWGESEAEVPEIWRRLLGNLAGTAREAVRLLVFERLPASRIAQQLGMEVKDVRLVLRNAAARLSKARAAGDAFDRMLTAA